MKCWVFFNVEGCNGQRKEIEEGGGDLEVHKQNVVSLEQTIGEQNVAPLELKIDESSNLCGLKLIMMTICNSNGEITLNID